MATNLTLQTIPFSIRVIDDRPGKDEEGNLYYRLRVTGPRGRTIELVVSLRDLTTDRTPLLVAGSNSGMPLITPAQQASFFNQVTAAITRVPDESDEPAFYVARQLGWRLPHYVYVTPDYVYGPSGAFVIPMLTEIERPHRWYLSGTLDDWRTFATWAARGNPLVILSFCTALVPPLLALLSEESFGVYLVGETSTGKSVLSSAAGSFWGGDPQHVLGFGLSWRSTVNALEMRALSARDGLLILDDSQNIPGNKRQRAETFRDALFGLTGGSEKARLNAPEAPRSWRTVIWSTGNDSVAKFLAAGGIDYDESYAVRMLEIPADRRHGVFDRIPPRYMEARFAERIKLEANRNFGWASDSCLRYLINQLAMDRQVTDEPKAGRLPSRSNLPLVLSFQQSCLLVPWWDAIEKTPCRRSLESPVRTP